MITAIEIENFKGFGERQRIEIAPITLLFGANSAGKSSVFHALFYLRELFAGNDPTPGLANYFSDRADLGGFRNTVHDHDEQRDIRFRIEFEVGDEARFGRRVGDFDLGEGKIAIEVVVGFWREETSRSDGITSVDKAIVREYCVQRNADVGEYKFLPLISLRAVERAKPRGFWNVDLTTDVELLSYLYDVRGQRADKLQDYTCRVALSRGAMPTEPKTQHPHESKDYYLTEAINGVLYASKEYLRICLEDLFYIGPWREIPNSQHIPQSSIQRSRWAGGLAAWDMIMDSISGTFNTRMNYWLGRLLGIHIVRQRFYQELQYSDRDFIDRLIVKSAKECDTGNGEGKTLRVQDVGYGVSQIVPFVVALIMEEYKTVAIEQPELHLHPKLQAELGDFIIGECVAGPYDTQAIIETHSQHLLLRIKRRIRETMKGVVNEELSLSPHHVSVNYFHQENGETKIIPIHLDLHGEFVEPWPDDFFDLDLNERFS